MNRSIDGTLHLGPIAIPQYSFEDFSRPTFWQARLRELDPARRLKMRQELPAVGDQFTGIERSPGLERHARHDNFAPFRIGNSEDGRFGNSGIRKNHGFNFAGKNFFTTRYD